MARGGRGHHGRGFFSLGDAAFADAGAGEYPFVRGVHPLGKIVVGYNFFWCVGAGAENGDSMGTH